MREWDNKTELWTPKEMLVWRRDDGEGGRTCRYSCPRGCGHRSNVLGWSGLEMETETIRAEVNVQR